MAKLEKEKELVYVVISSEFVIDGRDYSDYNLWELVEPVAVFRDEETAKKFAKAVNGWCRKFILK